MRISKIPHLLVYALLAVVAYPVIRMLIATYEGVADYGHGYFVPLIAGYAAWKRREAWKAIPSAPSMRGFLLFLPGLAVLLVGRWYDVALRPGGLGTEFVCGLGLVVLVQGLHVILFGWGRSRVMGFSLIFLLFAVPLPQTFSDVLVQPSRAWISLFSEKLISLIGIAVEREGNILHLDGSSLGIEDACSGIRSLWVLVTSMVAMAYLMGIRWKSLILVGLFAFPLAVVQNLLRVVLTAALVVHVNPAWASGFRHEFTGWFTFMLAAIFMLLALARITSKAKGAESVAEVEAEAVPESEGTCGYLKTVGGLLALSVLLQGIVWNHYEQRVAHLVDQSNERVRLKDLPVSFGGYDFHDHLALPDGQIDLIKPDDFWTGLYRNREGRTFFVMLFYWKPQRLGAYASAYRPHAPTVCYPASGFQPIDEPVEIQLRAEAAIETALSHFTRKEEEKIVLHWRNDLPRKVEERAPPALLRRGQALIRSWKEASVVIGRQYSVTVDTAVGGRVEEAEQAVLDFARTLEAELGPFDMR